MTEVSAAAESVFERSFACAQDDNASTKGWRRHRRRPWRFRLGS